MAESEFKACLSAHKQEHIISNGARGDTYSDGGASGARRREDGSPKGRDAGLPRLGLRQPFHAGARTNTALVGRGGKRWVEWRKSDGYEG